MESNNQRARLIKLIEVSKILLSKGSARSFILNNEDFIHSVVPHDFIALFDELIKRGYSIEELKPLTNKLLNIFHKPIANYPTRAFPVGSFTDLLVRNNQHMVALLNEIRPHFKALVRNPEDEESIQQLKDLFSKLERFEKHYTIKENVLFPIAEETWPDYRCIQIMWSFHDDIRRNIKYVLHALKEGIADLAKFKRCIGDIFFQMLAIKFREERLLFPYLHETLNEGQLERMNDAGQDLGYPYEHADIQEGKDSQTVGYKNEHVQLGTGALTPEQISLLFNHLPVDITYVDEHNRVRYFSSPPKRIFPRTTAIIGREVKNCHPPESVHVVEQIVDAFKTGKQNHADFWIKMKDEYILIQYFAVRDGQGDYRGIVEVSQEVSKIQSLTGEKRLLDW